MTFANTAASLRPEVNAPENVAVVPTGAALGAEIRGVDLSQPVPEATKEIMRRAWADHLVLLWRGQNLPDLSFLEAAGIFGVTREPAARKYQVAGGYKIGGKRVPLHPHVSLISNLNEEGEPVMHNGDLGSAEVVWHSDNSYTEVPPAGSMLYSVVIPTNGGGDTFFNNQYLAYEELPDDLKHAIAGRSQRHDASRNSAGVLRPTVKLPATPEEVPGPVHPLVRVPSGHGQTRALSRTSPRLAFQLHPGYAERRKREAAGPPMGARDPAEVCVGTQVARRRPRAVGQPLRDALPHRGGRQAGARALSDRGERGAGYCGVGRRRSPQRLGPRLKTWAIPNAPEISHRR